MNLTEINVRITQSEEDLSTITLRRKSSELKNDVVEVSPKGRFYRVISS